MNPARDIGPRFAHWLLPIPGKGSSEWSYSPVCTCSLHVSMCVFTKQKQSTSTSQWLQSHIIHDLLQSCRMPWYAPAPTPDTCGVQVPLLGGLLGGLAGGGLLAAIREMYITVPIAG